MGWHNTPGVFPVRQIVLTLILLGVGACGNEMPGDATMEDHSAGPDTSDDIPPGALEDSRVLPEAEGPFTEARGFVYLAAHGPLEWPSGSRIIRSARIAADDSAQWAERESGGAVLRLHTRAAGSSTPSPHRVSFEQVVRGLPAQWPDSPDLVEPDVLREDHPPYVEVWVAAPSEPLHFWSGPAEELPPAFRELLGDLERQLNAPASPMPDVAAWLLAELLAPAIAAEKLRAGAVEALDDDDLAISPRLEEGLANPFLLIPIPEGDNPFVPLSWTSYTPGRSTANVAWRDTVFHVRPLHNGAAQQ
jgi:hypothetical protein